MDYKKRPGKKTETIGELINKKEKKTISIITPFYNGGKTLIETTNTVLNQTYPYYELIIVDDGSKDEESLQKLKEIEKLDPRIKIFHKENGGPSVARDFGISKSSKDSKYIFFLDCDDLMENTMLEVLYWTLETHPEASFAYTTMVNFGDNEFIWEKYLTIDKEKKENLVCISSMIKKSDLLEVGCFGIKEKAMYEDWNLWLKLLANGKIPIRVNAPIFWYRTSNTGELSRAKKNHERAMEFIETSADKIKEDVKIIQFPRYKENIEEKVIQIKGLPNYKKSTKKKILFMLPWTVLGGADLFNLELIKRLDKTKYEIIIITTLPSKNDLRNEFVNEVSEYYDLSTFLDREDYLNFVDYIIDSRKVDTLFISNSKTSYYMLPSLTNKYENLQVVDYIHSIDPNDKKGGFGRCSMDMDQYIDKTYCCNNFTKHELSSKFNKNNVETIYIGTDEKRFDPSKFNKVELKEKYNIPKDKYIISFIARLSEEKRPELFVKIAKKLLKKRDDLHFIIAGDGYLYNNIKKMINDNFTLLGAINKPEEIYAISDLTVNCSSLEGLALTSYESLAMGVPIVSTNVGGQTELIDDTVGRIVEYTKDNIENEIEDYANKIEEVLNNIKSLQKNCRQKILDKYTFNKMVNKFEEIFNSHKINKKNKVNDNYLFYKIAMESIDIEHYNNVRYYMENTFGLNYDKEDIYSKKYILKNKMYNFFSKYNCVKEAKNILNLMYITYHITFGLLKNILYFLMYLLISLYSGLAIIYKIIKKAIK